MKYIATNNAESTLASGIGAGDVTLTLTTGTGALFPSPGANEAFKLRLKEGATMEIVDCTSRLGDVCTVIRAREGTSASAFNAGASVVNTITAEHLMSKIDYGSAVFELTANKGQANGYASLGADGKVPAGQLPASSSTFLGLSDTPSSYTGQQGKVVAVNSAQNALEFISAGGSGDMLASVYDPSNIASNVFSCDNHVGGTTNKVFTATEQSKLAGIAAGAEVNVNADWNAGSGDARILNKPSTFAPSSHNNSAHSEPFGIVYYGTGAPPTAVGKSDGTLYFKYTP